MTVTTMRSTLISDRSLDSMIYLLETKPNVDIARPWTSSASWAESAFGDQCQYGQQTEAGYPLKKPTGWMSDLPELL